jgi:hypothetical protein
MTTEEIPWLTQRISDLSRGNIQSTYLRRPEIPELESRAVNGREASMS